MLYLATNEATNTIELRGDYAPSEVGRGVYCSAYVNYERLTDSWNRNISWSSIKSQLIVYAARFLNIHQADIIIDINGMDSLIEKWYEEPTPCLWERILCFDDTGVYTYYNRQHLYDSENAFSIRRFRKIVAVTFDAKDAGTGNGYDVDIILHELD